MKKRTFALLLTAAMTLSLLSGCGGGDSSSSSSNSSGNTAATEAPDSGASDTSTSDTSTSDTGSSSDQDAATAPAGETLAADQSIQVHWAAENFYSFDNNKNYAAEEIQVQSHVLEGLVRPAMDENGSQFYEPAGAETWDISDDGLTWTFHLREYYWTDGVQVTAQHFVDSFRRLADPRNGCDFASFVDDIVGGPELYGLDASEASDAEIDAAMEALAVKAVDDTTLEIQLRSPAPQFLSKVSCVWMYPVRLDVIEAAGDMYDTDLSTHVWCGPFTVTEFMKDNSMVLTKNESYWDAEHVYLNQITLINIGETSTQSTMFKNGELAVLAPTGDYVQPYRDGAADGDYTYVAGYFPNVTYFYFNRNSESLSGLMESQKVRLALSLAANREEFTQVVFGRYNPAYGFVPLGVTVDDINFRDTVKEPLLDLAAQYDTPEKIQALFKEGMEELGDTRELSDVTITYICTGDTAIKRQQQEYWKNLWETTLGIHVDVNVLGDSSLLTEERNAGRYDIGQAGWNGDYNDPIAFLEMWSSHGTSLRYSGWSEEKAAEFDQFMDRLNSEADPAKRVEIYAEMEKWVVCDEVAAIPYMYTDNILCISNKIKGVETPFVGPYFDFTHAYMVE